MAVAVSQCLSYSLVEWLTSCENSLQEQTFDPRLSCWCPKFKKLSVLPIKILSLSWLSTSRDFGTPTFLFSLWICDVCARMRVRPSDHWVEFISRLDALCAALPACCWFCRTFTFSEMTSELILWSNYFVYGNL